MSTSYVATAVREGRWWVITVEDVGVTQARTLRDAPAAARGMLCALLDIDEDGIQVEVTPGPRAPRSRRE